MKIKVKKIKEGRYVFINTKIWVELLLYKDVKGQGLVQKWSRNLKCEQRVKHLAEIMRKGG